MLKVNNEYVKMNPSIIKHMKVPSTHHDSSLNYVHKFIGLIH